MAHMHQFRQAQVACALGRHAPVWKCARNKRKKHVLKMDLLDAVAESSTDFLAFKKPVKILEKSLLKEVNLWFFPIHFIARGIEFRGDFNKDCWQPRNLRDSLEIQMSLFCRIQMPAEHMPPVLSLSLSRTRYRISLGALKSGIQEQVPGQNKEVGSSER